MSKTLSILIIVCLIVNTAYAGESNSNTIKNQETEVISQTAYEHLMSVAGSYSKSRKTLGGIILGYGVIGLVTGTYGELQYHFNPNVDPEI